MSGAGPNRLLELLDADGDFSLPNLKRRYRLLAKEAHPDLSGRHEAFLLLNAEYRAALEVVRGKGSQRYRSAPPRGPAPRSESGAKTRTQTRRETLELLRVYAFKFYTPASASQLDAFIRAAAEYDPKRARLLCAYKTVFLDSYHAWLSDGRVYYAHALLISAVRQLFHYFESGSSRHKTLLDAFLSDARSRASRLESDRRRVVEAFADWIGEEAREPFGPQ